MKNTRSLTIGGVLVNPGSTQDLRLKVSETYTGDDISIPIRVIRSARKGPTVLVCAAIHGDELNGTGIIHELMFREEMKLRSGTLVLVPVVNVLGFENNVRYLPDRRDLNRSFPGMKKGSLASRIAATIMGEFVSKCDYCIDLHTSAMQRTNFPNVRGDLGRPEVRRFAQAFGCELILNSKGPAGSLRRAACRVGCATILLEVGEPSKIQPVAVEVGLRGIQNSLIKLKMLKGKSIPPPYQVEIERTRWVRAQVGGILRAHVLPGDPIEKGQPIATNYSVLGKEQNVLTSPVNGVVLSVVTMPTVKPGEPVCHIAIPEEPLTGIRRALKKLARSSTYHTLSRQLSSDTPFEDNR